MEGCGGVLGNRQLSGRDSKVKGSEERTEMTWGCEGDQRFFHHGSVCLRSDGQSSSKC